MEQTGNVPMRLYAERDNYGGFTVAIIHSHPDKIGLVKNVMSEKPQPFILGEGVSWKGACSTPNLDIVRVEYKLDTTRPNLHMWSYQVMLFIFRWYCARTQDFFKGSVIGTMEWSCTNTAPHCGNPAYYSLTLSASVAV